MIIFARLSENDVPLIVSTDRPVTRSTLPFGTLENVSDVALNTPADVPRLPSTMSPVLVPATAAVTVLPAPAAPLHTSLARPCKSAFDP